jgi:hypothetical protein
MEHCIAEAEPDDGTGCPGAGSVGRLPTVAWLLQGSARSLRWIGVGDDEYHRQAPLDLSL